MEQRWYYEASQKLISKNKHTVVSLKLCCNKSCDIAPSAERSCCNHSVSPFGWRSLTNSASQQTLWARRSHLEELHLNYRSYTELIVSSSGTRPVFLSREAKSRGNPITGQMGSTKEWNLSRPGKLSPESSSVRGSFQMKHNPPAVTVSAGPVGKLSAKNLLSGLTGKVISLAGKANTHTHKNKTKNLFM